MGEGKGGGMGVDGVQTRGSEGGREDAVQLTTREEGLPRTQGDVGWEPRTEVGAEVERPIEEALGKQRGRQSGQAM